MELFTNIGDCFYSSYFYYSSFYWFLLLIESLKSIAKVDSVPCKSAPLRFLLIFYLEFCSANQWTGFYMIMASFMRELKKTLSFPSRISSVNMAKSARNCGFGHHYWRNPYLKDSFFCAVLVTHNINNVRNLITKSNHIIFSNISYIDLFSVVFWILHLDS